MSKILVLLCLVLLVPVTTLAHETKYSGTIGVLLHLEPLDNPAVNEQAHLYFAFSDEANKFKIENCECSVKISSNGEIFQQSRVMEENYAPDWGDNVARIPFVFPKKAIYQVELTSLSADGSFEDFTLNYDVRIERESEAAPLAPVEEPDNSLRNYYVIGGAAIFSGIIIYEVFNRKKRKK